MARSPAGHWCAARRRATPEGARARLTGSGKRRILSPMGNERKTGRRKDVARVLREKNRHPGGARKGAQRPVRRKGDRS